MDIRITPSKLNGTVSVPSSKSITHRMLICAGLADGISVIRNISFSKDIHATINAMKALGAEFEINGSSVTVTGIGRKSAENAVIDCCESGSTLRFMIPVAAVLGTAAEFRGQGRLPQRPITPYIREMSDKGIIFNYDNTMPFSISGKLKGGKYCLEGDISSQFITGMLLALPLAENDSEIIMTSPLQSKPYADMTVRCLENFGIEINETDNGYYIKGNQHYKPYNTAVEGDYSQAAFFFVADAIGNNVKISNLADESIQGDKKIVEIISALCYNNSGNEKSVYSVDAENIPDLVPVLAVLCSLSGKTSEITGIQRLKIKESDRIISTADMINSLGGKAIPSDDSLLIKPVESFIGGTVDSCGDHRIVMSAAIAATRARGDVVILNADAVEKSYPDFFSDFNNIGGKANVINVE
ncbi:MAG TPA: 3-phosphoshikimate 1-carboxyvinyltransferase [Ruminococcus sp.]|nr:3-phosphoshikimate 1-carboxyvinyltransferase [Ruminococcus sp.]HCR74553.1 3-phosphoshikimate 1-carboxyvinyltransferase [Ruminococcus sp.]